MRAEAERFIEAVTGAKESPLTFQTFPEGGQSNIPPRILHGTLDQHWDELVHLNQSGHGIFAMVNEGDGHGWSGDHVIALRAQFTDDGGKTKDGFQWPRPGTGFPRVNRADGNLCTRAKECGCSLAESAVTTPPPPGGRNQS